MSLQVRNLCAGYGFISVLHDINLSIKQGQMCSVLGANGAGKTTLLRAIAGLIKSTGTIAFGDKRIDRCTVEQVVRSGLSLVPQERGTFVDLTVHENLLLGAYGRKNRDEVATDIDSWYGRFPVLRKRQSEAGGNLSGGEQQMLAVARALMARPKLLLLDEPSAGLAPITARDVFSTLREINETSQVGILVVEQNIELALDLTTFTYVLEAGAIVASGTSEALRANDSIQRSYLGAK